MRITLILFAMGMLIHSSQSKCLKTMFRSPCTQDKDCHLEKEFTLFCNKTITGATCAFNEQVYIGHVYEDWDCPGQKFSAVPWSNPVPPHLATNGLDCMRLCLHTKTCFGISVKQTSCYLRNDLCFDHSNLVRTPNSILGVLRIIREDYHCGCNYPFERQRVNGSISDWFPLCPGSNLKASRYRCCSKKGLCETC